MPSKLAYWPTHIESQHPLSPCVFVNFWELRISALIEDDSPKGEPIRPYLHVYVFMHRDSNKFSCLLGMQIPMEGS